MPDITLHLFGGPYITRQGSRTEVPEGSKRLLAFLALRGARVDRRYAAGALWPFGDDTRAGGNLRSALWRLRVAGIDLVYADKWSLGIGDNVVVDVVRVQRWAARLIAGTAADEDLDLPHGSFEALEFLPGWYDDWALMERERMRQRMLHALEALSDLLRRCGRCADAIDAALLAVSVEPLRESAQRALIAAHLAEGNWVEGRRTFQAYRELLRRDLGAEPGAELAAMLESARTSVGRPQHATDARRVPVAF
jgi:DNA-binding SARP family transcriptional activator